MKALAQYLAEYLDYEHELGERPNFIDNYPDGSVYLDTDCLRVALEQGIEAYQSTEDCLVTTTANTVFGSGIDCDKCRKLGESTCGNDMTLECFEPRT